FGALTVVTGPTVIVPMLRTVRPSADVANVLRWEGILIDPIGAILAVVVYEFIVAGTGGTALGHSLAIFGGIIATGLVLGAIGGQVLGLALRQHWLPEYMHNFGTLAFLVGLFVLSNGLVEESGLLTVTVMGIRLANMKDVDVEDLLNFKESLSLVLISGLFILLAARVEWHDFATLGWGAALVLLGMQLVARPVAVLISTYGSTLGMRERALIGWIAPRGIVAAAVSALFALRLEEAGVAQAGMLVPLTFLVIIVTVLLQSFTARPLARALGVAAPDGHGFLIIGANPLAVAIARELKRHGLSVLLVDSSWENSRKARMEGLPVYFGNAVSDHADRHLDLVGLTGLLALSWRGNVNALACLRFRGEFGAANTFTLASGSEPEGTEGSRYHNIHFGQVLFAERADFSSLAGKLKDCFEVRSTRISDKHSFADWRQRNGEEAMPLFVIDRAGKAKPFVAGHERSVEAGDVLIGLVREGAPATRETAPAA
ncbi:MAG TPA: sodium:proton antiporter, partial [Hyphomicrobiales bacterium]|nr:sodium:proton antiporter [Hyphomicrobiales bacterium]